VVPFFFKMPDSSNNLGIMFHQIFFPYLQPAAEILYYHFETNFLRVRSSVRINLTIIVAISLFLFSCSALQLSSEKSIDYHFSLFG
jgi:uncharacterized membrane protein YGL010W